MKRCQDAVEGGEGEVAEHRLITENTEVYMHRFRLRTFMRTSHAQANSRRPRMATMLEICIASQVMMSNAVFTAPIRWCMGSEDRAGGTKRRDDIA